MNLTSGRHEDALVRLYNASFRVSAEFCSTTNDPGKLTGRVGYPRLDLFYHGEREPVFIFVNNFAALGG
jgi:hypothetical protein